MGPPPDLVELIRDAFGIRVFVETGTYLGRTANWASKIFANVITIEASEAIWNRTRVKYSHKENIKFLYGKSEEMLAKVARSLNEPAVFWLDAHWSGSDTYGGNSICPIRQEIEAVLNASTQHFILVDDVRFFLAPPPRPNNPDDWPSVGELLGDLHASRPDGYQAIIEDVLISVPGHARTKIIEYCQSTQNEEDARRRRERKLSMLSLKSIKNALARRT